MCRTGSGVRWDRDVFVYELSQKIFMDTASKSKLLQSTTGTCSKRCFKARTQLFYVVKARFALVKFVDIADSFRNKMQLFIICELVYEQTHSTVTVIWWQQKQQQWKIRSEYVPLRTVQVVNIGKSIKQLWLHWDWPIYHSPTFLCRKDDITTALKIYNIYNNISGNTAFGLVMF